MEGKFEGKEFPGGLSLGPGSPLSYAYRDHPWSFKNK
jgi:hypothetical protein